MLILSELINRIDVINSSEDVSEIVNQGLVYSNELK